MTVRGRCVTRHPGKTRLATARTAIPRQAKGEAMRRAPPRFNHPQGESNPCCRHEKPVSWATRRWGYITRFFVEHYGNGTRPARRHRAPTVQRGCEVYVLRCSSSTLAALHLSRKVRDRTGGAMNHLPESSVPPEITPVGARLVRSFAVAVRIGRTGPRLRPFPCHRSKQARTGGR